MKKDQLAEHLRDYSNASASAMMAQHEAAKRFECKVQEYVTALCAENTVQAVMDTLEADSLFDTHHTRMQESAIYVRLSTGGEVVLHGFKPDPPKPCDCNCHKRQGIKSDNDSVE